MPHSTHAVPPPHTASYPTAAPLTIQTDARTTICDARPPRDDALHVQRLGARTGRQGARLVAARGARHGRSRRRARSAAAGFGLLRQLVCLPPHRALSCPSEPCADACGLLARSDAYTCPDSGSGGSSCDDACDTGCKSSCDGSCDDSCNSGCDFIGNGWLGSCDACNRGCDNSCDGGCTSSCDGGCDTCADSGKEYYSCDSGCTSGCSACPYGQYSAASTSLVAPPSRRGRAAKPAHDRHRVCHPDHTQPHHMHGPSLTRHSSRCTPCARRPGAAHLQF